MTSVTQKILRIISFYVFPLSIAALSFIFIYTGVSTRTLGELSRNFASLGTILLVIILFAKPLSVLGFRNFSARSISLKESFFSLSSLTSAKKIFSHLRDIIASLSRWILSVRRELGIIVFYMIFSHFVFFWISWAKDGSSLTENIQETFIMLGMIGLIALFLGWITSNNISVNFFGKHWKKIQYASYIGFLFGALHVMFIGGFEYITLAVLFVILKIFEWIPKKSTRENLVTLSFTDAAGEKRTVQVPRAGQSLLEALESKKLNISSGCRTGTCGKCLCKIDAGNTLISGVSGGKNNEILTCVSSIMASNELTDETIKLSIPREDLSQEAEIVNIARSPSGKNILFTLRPAGHFEFIEGQHVRISTTLQGKKASRTYSIASTITSYERTGTISLLIKHVPQGKFSTFLAHECTLGTKLQLSEAFGNLADPKTNKNYLLISIGSGLAPNLSWYKNLIETEQYNKLICIHGEQTEEDFVPEVLSTLQTPHKNTRSILCLSREEKENFHHGYVDTALEKALGFIEGIDITCVLCGKPDMTDKVRAKLIESGISEKNIHVESY